MLLLIAQLGISAFGCAAFLFITKEPRWCQITGTVLGLISNPFWWMMMVATEQWITIPVHLAYTYGWISLAHKLWKTRGA